MRVAIIFHQSLSLQQMGVIPENHSWIYRIQQMVVSTVPTETSTSQLQHPWQRETWKERVESILEQEHHNVCAETVSPRMTVLEKVPTF